MELLLARKRNSPKNARNLHKKKKFLFSVYHQIKPWLHLGDENFVLPVLTVMQDFLFMVIRTILILMEANLCYFNYKKKREARPNSFFNYDANDMESVLNLAS